MRRLDLIIISLLLILSFNLGIILYPIIIPEKEHKEYYFRCFSDESGDQFLFEDENKQVFIALNSSLLLIGNKTDKGDFYGNWQIYDCESLNWSNNDM